MRISLLAAVDVSNGIGRDGKLPWHLGADLAHFKRLTMGHHLLMGRKTFESIGKALPGRRIILLTRNEAYSVPGVILARSLDEALRLAENAEESELFIAGGGEVFAQSLRLADRLYLTRVHTQADCQVFFPRIAWQEWSLLETGYHPQDARNDYAFDFNRLEKSPAGRP